MQNALATCSDEDLDAWEFEAKRWARVLFLAIKEEFHLTPILMVHLDLFFCSLLIFTPCFICSLYFSSFFGSMPVII